MSAPLYTRLQNLTRRFLRDRNGNISLMVSASLIPIVAASGMAIDMMRINDARASIQAVADAAVLAAVKATGTDQQRVAIGTEFVKKNLHDITGVTVEPKIIVKGKDGTANMNVKVEGTLTKVLFSQGDPGAELGKSSAQSSDGVDFVVTSKAHAADGKTTWRCVIALNKTDPDTTYISGSGDFNAENCAVHADSSNSTAMHRQGAGIASASEWTVVGGYQETGSSGAFSSVPVTNSAVFNDPFALSITVPGGAATNQLVKKQDGLVTLNPGKFNNLTIQTDGRVKMNPGTYYITGTLALGSGGSLDATAGVTLIFSGNTSQLSMNATDSWLQITAPTTGTYAGFGVIQNPASDASGVTHNVQGGAQTILKGIWYTPVAKLLITGGGGFNASSAYFPIVTGKFETTGSGVFRIGIDWLAYGFPVPTPLKIIEQAEVRLTY